MNGFYVKKDCFAYDPCRRKCKALNDLYCSYQNCKFYKTEKERCAECRATRTNITCQECKTRGLK